MEKGIPLQHLQPRPQGSPSVLTSHQRMSPRRGGKEASYPTPKLPATEAKFWVMEAATRGAPLKGQRPFLGHSTTLMWWSQPERLVKKTITLHIKSPIPKMEISLGEKYNLVSTLSHKTVTHKVASRLSQGSRLYLQLSMEKLKPKGSLKTSQKLW